MTAPERLTGATLPGADADAAASTGLFYGWRIVALTFTTQFVMAGTIFYSFGVLLKPLAETLQAPRLAVGLGLTANMVVGALLGPWIGRLVATRSIRAVMLSGVLLTSAGFVALSQARSVLHLYLAFGGLLSLGMGLLGGLANATLLANWFERRRGTAMGISQFGISISGTVMVPVATLLIASYGWRVAVGVFALLPLVVLAPLVWLVVVNRPEDRGLHPDGDASPAVAEDEDGGDWNMGRALRDHRVLLLALIVGACFATVGALTQVLYSHATDLGLSDGRAATIVALMAFMGAVGKPTFGILSDWASKRGATALCIGLQVLGLLLLLRATSFVALVSAGLVFGLGYGGVLTLWGVLLGTLFGRQSFGRIMGLMGPLILPFQVIGLPFATWVFDRTGSYLPAFWTFLGFYAVAALALAFLRLPTPYPLAVSEDAPDPA